ncbi:retrovirus-related pol polyprotein from transposon TNT 1-94 [Tanacetum coccineum]|uniref:Retrovirus-related pol polyprotein from transposon TNT 1-94 n=1 Tax=Tanacetum coccineum TaxID=301880 RepID=A0ABQ5A7T7_9ASTR
MQVVLWYLDSGCSKYMTGNRLKLKNFVEKFIGTVRFGNDHFGVIMGYGDYVYGDSVISRVYYVEVLGHNLFYVGQFCNSDLEIAFRKHSCFVRDMNGVDLLKGSRSTNLYTISIDDMMKSSPVCLLSKASKIKSWLWHRRLNHLNFGTINDLARKDLVRGLPRLKFEKYHLCSACQLGKIKKYSHKPKNENTNMEVLYTLHMDLCGPIRVQSINGKKYILVIVDDYSRFTWVKFLRSKDETPEFVINFLKQIQVGLNKTVRYIRTDNGTEFVNQVMSKYYEGVGIFHQKSVLRTPQQNGVVEIQNRTLVEAACIMLIFSKAPMFLWAEAVATALFGALCYPTNDSEDLGKLQAKADIGIFVGYAPSRKGFRIYNKRTRRIMETIHVTFDELHQSMAPVHISSGPEPMSMTPGQFSSGLIPNQVHATNYVLPTDKDLELLFQPMFDEYFEVTRVDEPVPSATAVNAQVVPPGTSVSTTFAQDAPSTSYSPSSSGIQPPVIHHDVAVGPTIEDTPITQATLHPSVNPVTRLLEIQVRHNHHLGMLMQRNPTKLTTLQIISEDGPKIILWITLLAIPLVLYGNLYLALSNVMVYRSQVGIYQSKALMNWNIHCKCRNQEYDQSIRWDVKTAFLNGDLQEEVFVSQPEGFGRPDITANVPKSTLKLRSVFRYLKGTINMDYGIEKTNAYVPNSLMQMRIMRVSRFKKRVTSGKVLSFLEIDWLAGSSRNNEARQYQLLEAEYIAISGCCAQILWMLIPAQRTNGFDFNKIPLYLDNKSAIALCCNNVQHSRSKHINIRHHFIREQVENRVVLYSHKELTRERFEFLLPRLGMKSLTTETLKRLQEGEDE